MDADKRAVVDVCVRILESLKVPGAAGRDQFLATLAPHGTACHSRFMVSNVRIVMMPRHLPLKTQDTHSRNCDR
jgi:hypothetical protein